MYAIVKVILIGSSLLASAKMLVCPTPLEKTTLREVPVLIEPLRVQLKYEDNSNKNIKPKLPESTVLYRIKSAKPAKIYLFSVSDVGDLSLAGGFTGSAGARVLIYEVRKDGTFEKLFDFNVVKIFGTIGASSIHPDIIVLLHGGRFERPGDERGVGVLKFNDRKREYVVDDEEIDQTKLEKSCPKLYEKKNTGV